MSSLNKTEITLESSSTPLENIIQNNDEVDSNLDEIEIHLGDGDNNVVNLNIGVDKPGILEKLLSLNGNWKIVLIKCIIVLSALVIPPLVVYFSK